MMITGITWAESALRSTTLGQGTISGTTPLEVALARPPASGRDTHGRTSAAATLFTPLHARYSLPSRVATILRTTPPPEGIGHVLNAAVLGSNRTSVFGLTPLSLYHIIPSDVAVIP